MIAAATAFSVDTGSFLVIVATAALAGTLAAVAGSRGLFVPVVVVELVLGIVIGPQVLDIAQVNGFTDFFSALGLGMLFFFAGLITRQVVSTREVKVFDSKLSAVAFGVFVPFFFVVSGMRLDTDALFASASGVAKLLLFFVLFLIARGSPALLLYRRVLPLREDRMALAVFTATQLPLVVAITTVAVDGGHMQPSTAAALVGAGALSTLVGPLHGLRMRRIAAHKRASVPA